METFFMKLYWIKQDNYRKIPYTVALKYKHAACAALLNPSSPEPLVWPAPLKFISDLNPEARTLLEKALITANKDREMEILKDTINSFPSSPVHSDSGAANDISEVTCLFAGFFIFSILNQYILNKFWYNFFLNLDRNLS